MFSNFKSIVQVYHFGKKLMFLVFVLPLILNAIFSWVYNYRGQFIAHYLEDILKIIPVLVGLYFCCRKTWCLSVSIVGKLAVLCGSFLNVFFVPLPVVLPHMSGCELLFVYSTQGMLYFS